MTTTKDEIKLTAGRCYYIKVRTQDWGGYAFKIRKGSKYYNTIDIGNDGNSLVSGINIEPGQEIRKIYNSFYVDRNHANCEITIYRVKTTSNPGSTYTFSFKGIREKSGYLGNNTTQIKIYDENYKKIYVGEIDYSKDNRELTTVIEHRDNSIFYVVVRDDSIHDNTDDRDYVFSFEENTNTEKPGKPSITSLTGGKGSLTVKYSAVKNGVSFYQIAYKKYGAKKWSYVTVGSLMQSKLITGLTRNQKYSVMVRAIKKVNGEKYVGEWSAAKQVKTK